MGRTNHEPRVRCHGVVGTHNQADAQPTKHNQGGGGTSADHMTCAARSSRLETNTRRGGGASETRDTGTHATSEPYEGGALGVTGVSSQ